MLKQGFITRTGTDGVVRNYVESTLIAIGTNVLELNNEKKTPYHVGTVQFVTSSGEMKNVSTQIWAKNAEKMTVGQNYLTEVRTEGGVTYLNTSILNVTKRAVADDFAFEAEVVPTAQNVGNATIPA